MSTPLKSGIRKTIEKGKKTEQRLAFVKVMFISFTSLDVLVRKTPVWNCGRLLQNVSDLWKENQF